MYSLCSHTAVYPQGRALGLLRTGHSFCCLVRHMYLMTFICIGHFIKPIEQAPSWFLNRDSIGGTLHHLQRLKWLVEDKRTNDKTMLPTLKNNTPTGYQGPLEIELLKGVGPLLNSSANMPY